MSGYLIPPPPDPVLRAEWEAGVAAREAAGLSVYVGEDYITDGHPAPSGTTLRYLSRGDIGRWFGVGGETVRKWQERHGAGGDGGYRPFPHPDVILDRSPGWSPHREAEIRAWYKGRPGRGAGGGRPRKRQLE